MKEIHKKFGSEYGFSKVEPKLFSMSEYQFQLEHILEEGEAFLAIHFNRANNLL
jgi:hypothetical protein